MAKKIVGIYQIVCTKNGKNYVGQSVDIKRRFTQHKRKPSSKMLDDFKLFGVDAFKFEILEECDVTRLNERENFYLNTLKPVYNIRTEGRGISDKARGKLRKLQTGKKRPNISRKVKCVETGEIFDSITAAAQWCSVPCSTISVLLTGKGRTTGGYHWIYADDGNEEAALERIHQMPEGRRRTEKSKEKQRQAMTGRKHTPEHSEKIRQSHIGQGWKPSTYDKLCRKILCVETNEIFPSIKTAAEHYALKSPNISAVLSGKKRLSVAFIGNTLMSNLHNTDPTKCEKKSVSPFVVSKLELFTKVFAKPLKFSG